MSGMVAQRVTVEARERVRSLVAVAPVPASGLPLDASSQALFGSSTTHDDAWLAISDMMTGGRLLPAWHRQQLAALRRTVDPAAYLGFPGMWTGTDFAASLRGTEDLPALERVSQMA
jgi:pimeloyl-ACP methyl ester carboxylesterase